jgi:hypothetical protein
MWKPIMRVKGRIRFLVAWQKKKILEEFMIKRRKISKAPLSLGDLILAVSSYADSQEETVATVADLLASGQVRLMNNGRKVRAKVR